MISYLNLVDDVLDFGKWKSNRTGVRTITLPNMHFNHSFGTIKQLPASSMWINWNMPPTNTSTLEETLKYKNDLAKHEANQPFIIDNFPLLTTKRVAFQTLCVELEGFINGITDKKWYQERKCNIWNEWANPCQVQQKMNNLVAGTSVDDGYQKILQQELTDLGPIYGYQWRKFGEHYGPLDPYEENAYAQLNGIPPEIGGFDQLKYIVETLKTNPNDRRLVCSAWNPNQKHLQALPPCHLCFVITVIENTISLHWTQRSCDLMLGVPFNIASYGLLLCLLATSTGLQPDNLSGMLCDCHIYENHIPAAKEQQHRTPRKLPSIKILENDIFKWTHNDVELIDYYPHPKIDFGDIAI